MLAVSALFSLVVQLIMLCEVACCTIVRANKEGRKEECQAFGTHLKYSKYQWFVDITPFFGHYSPRRLPMLRHFTAVDGLLLYNACSLHVLCI